MSERTKAPSADTTADPEALTRGAETATTSSTPLAKTTDPSQDFRLFAPIEKVSRHDDGTLVVDVTFSSEAVDDQGEIVDYGGLKKAAVDYAQWGSVNEMHQPSAVGVALSVIPDDATRKVTGQVHVVDPIAVKKVETGVYKGVSIEGRRIAWLMQKAGGRDVRRVTDLLWTRTSLVDRGSNPDAVLTIAKRAEEPPAEEVSARNVPPIAKSAADDAGDMASNAAWLLQIADREAEQGDADTANRLKAIAQQILAEASTEAEEVGTPEDTAESEVEEPIPVVVVGEVIEYAAGKGDDLAKVTEPDPTLAKSALLADEDFISKVAALVDGQLSGFAKVADVEATTGELGGRIDGLVEELAKVAKRAAPGGPLRYIDQRGVPISTDAATTPADAADVLRKAAEAETDPLVKEALQKRAAVELAKVALSQPIRIGG
jgi:hypothetical protein